MQIIQKYFSELSDNQIQQFIALKDLYEDWNTKINVISRNNIHALYTNHILHSLAIAKLISFSKGTKVLDVGTGGGFPGIPLAILFPEVEFLLIDSIGKKIKVVDSISNTLELANIRTRNTRVENINESFDFIVSRAVTNMTEFNKWVKGKFNNNNQNSISNGVLYLKGGDLSEELKGIPHVQYDISDFFTEDFFKTKKIIYIEH